MRSQRFSLRLIPLLVFLVYSTTVLPDPIMLDPGYGEMQAFATGFEGPMGLAFDDQGNLYVTNEGFVEAGTYPGTVVSRVTPDGGVSTFADSLFGPSGVAFNSAEGYLYVSDDSNRVVRIDPAGQVEELFYLPEGQPGNPNAIGFDALWNLYVVAAGGAIYKVAPEGNMEVFVDSDEIPGGFSCPQSIAFDNDGDLYTSDGSSRIFRITPEGSVDVYATFPDGTNGGLAFDNQGNIYVSGGLDTVYKISPSGEVEPFVTGFKQMLGNVPRGIAFGDDGSFYVAEFGTGIVWTAKAERIPEPSTILLLATGLGGIAVYGNLSFRRKKKA